ncbi:GAF domain-containing sensor histidine kinase [Actinoallomurus acaciae]|uniref:histidine kinase n=1 Tax=Actinoallomurus acaciae TaxID=502577 RepID=A0ABV5YAC0_9ACTN
MTTLVARGASPARMSTAVARELGHLLGGDQVTISRYGPDRTTVVVGRWARRGSPAFSARYHSMDESAVEAEVARTGRPARRADHARHGAATGTRTRACGPRYIVACPVVVKGRLWGLMAEIFPGPAPGPEGAEEPMSMFAELLAAAIADAEYRAELLASRARLALACDATRRGIERDLHDGVQQRLVLLALGLRDLRDAVGDGLSERVSRLQADLYDAMADLGEVSHGLHPVSLSHGGIDAALKSLARRSPLPVELSGCVGGRLAEAVETAVYAAASEALANTLEHAHATRAHLDVRLRGGAVWMWFHDDGRGGGDLAYGAGLIGLRDRVEALGGDLAISSPPGQGTSLHVRVPAR